MASSCNSTAWGNLTSGRSIAPRCSMRMPSADDLQIVLICPNGQQMILKSYASGGNGTYLGNPIDNTTGGPGTGSLYCFTPTATTLLVNGGTVTSGSPAGNSIAAGNYMTVAPFTNLVGCPLNGTWTIQVTDNLSADDGYIFNWDVNFTTPPATGSFTPTIASQGWNAATGLTSTGLTTATITPTAAGTPCYTYTVVDNFGCTWTQNQCITVNANTPVNAGADVTICTGGSTTLTASGAATYTWSPATGLSATTGATVTSTPAATITYTVTGTTGTCTSTDQVIVTVNPVATANANVDQTVCVGGSITLTGSVGGSATSGTWSAPSGTFSNASSLTSTYTPTITSGTVTLTLTTNDPAGPCLAVTDQMIITVNPLPTVSAGPDVAICTGASTTLTATGAATYTWSPATGLSGTTTASVTANPTATTTYTVTGTSAAGCINTDQVVVTVNPLPTVNAGVDQTICVGATVTLSGSGASTYTWNNGVTNGVAFTPAATTTYTVTGTDANGCINTDQVVVTVNPLPTVNAGVDQTVCAGTPVTLNGSGASIYVWSGGITNGVAFTPAATTTYTLTGDRKS